MERSEVVLSDTLEQKMQGIVGIVGYLCRLPEHIASLQDLPLEKTVLARALVQICLLAER